MTNGLHVSITMYGNICLLFGQYTVLSMTLRSTKGRRKTEQRSCVTSLPPKISQKIFPDFLLERKSKTRSFPLHLFFFFFFAMRTTYFTTELLITENYFAKVYHRVLHVYTTRIEKLRWIYVCVCVYVCVRRRCAVLEFYLN